MDAKSYDTVRDLALALSDFLSDRARKTEEIERLMAENTTLRADRAELQDQLRDCEMSLKVFDEGLASEYWTRHAYQPSNE